MPCPFRATELLSAVGRRITWSRWESAAAMFVHTLWDTTDWTRRLRAAKDAASQLAELVGSMTDEECRRCAFIAHTRTTAATAGMNHVGAEGQSPDGTQYLPCTMTEMPSTGRMDVIRQVAVQRPLRAVVVCI